MSRQTINAGPEANGTHNALRPQSTQKNTGHGTVLPSLADLVRRSASSARDGAPPSFAANRSADSSTRKFGQVGGSIPSISGRPAIEGGRGPTSGVSAPQESSAANLEPAQISCHGTRDAHACAADPVSAGEPPSGTRGTMLRKVSHSGESHHNEHGGPEDHDLEQTPREIASKRALTKRLPSDWRSAIREMIGSPQVRSPATFSRLAAAIYILELTGARPAELEIGVEVWREDDLLVIRINGAKLRNRSGAVGWFKTCGLPWRVIYIPADFNFASRYLYDISACGGEVVQYNAKSIGTRLAEIVSNTFPKKHLSISPYCYRHALATDLRSCETYTAEQIAKILGHASVTSARHYGTKKRTKKGLCHPGVVDVAAALEPRNSATQVDENESASNKYQRPIY